MRTVLALAAGAAMIVAMALPAGAAPAGYSVLGTDVSNHDGAIDWSGVAAKGVKFGWAKATEGLDFVDPQYGANYRGAKSNGVYIGAYAFGRPDKGAGTGKAQADYLVDHAQYVNDGKTLPLQLDIEWPWWTTAAPIYPCYGLSSGQMVQWIRDFVNEVKARTGREAAIYTNPNWWNQCTGSNTSFAANPLETSNYSGSPGALPAGWSRFTAWQYQGSSSTIPGSPTAFNGTSSDLAAFAGGGDLGVLEFYLSDSQTSSVATRPVISYGQSPMVPISGDWDGDGKDTVSTYDPTTGKFFISNDPVTGLAQYTFVYGNPGAVPLVGDWDGDGKDNIGVQMGNGFYMRTSPVTLATETTVSLAYGDAGMVPISGDWNGDGKDSVSAYDPTTGKFFISNDPVTGLAQYTFVYGNPGAVPLVGDWDGDGKDNIGVQMGNGFYMRTSPVTSATETTMSIGYGNGSGELPVIGDWDGDGKDSQGIAR
ncbi:GH25 family lysozyme [Sphaerisporangium perillae]|uniref:GH25 family lysozyme n=1 Tax=Sphaerisporangium perillae TaxID=2935860 RepID=UPI00200BC6D5|nr:GH25 family lysozyme [Sphaerisporangium perillae]